MSSCKEFKQTFYVFLYKRAQRVQNQTDHEEIVQGLTNSLMDESKRAQKAEV